MQGTILKYDKETHKGFISGHDGNRYTFTKADWVSDEDPAEGISADFETDEKEAKDIVALKSEENAEEGSVILPIFTFAVGLLMLCAAALAVEDDIADSDEIFGLGVWFCITIILAAISFMKTHRVSRGWTIAGLVMATMAFLGTWGAAL